MTKGLRMRKERRRKKLGIFTELTCGLRICGQTFEPVAATLEGVLDPKKRPRICFRGPPCEENGLWRPKTTKSKLRLVDFFGT